MVGILDRDAVNLYMGDMRKSIEELMNFQTTDLTVAFLEQRFEILKQETERLIVKRDDIQAELETMIARYSGELVTLNQMLRYALKEEGACEEKIAELNELIKKEKSPKAQ